MILRCLGSVIMLLGLIILAASIYGLCGMDSMSHLVFSGREPNSGVWHEHMRLYWIAWALAASFSVVSGSLLLMKKSAGLIFFIISSCIVLLYPLVIEILFSTAYKFEVMNRATALTSLALMIFSIVLYIRIRYSRMR